MIIESKYDEQSIAERKETINVEENMSTTSDKDIEMGSILDTAYENIDLSSIYSENSSVLPMTPSNFVMLNKLPANLIVLFYRSPTK